MHESILNLCQKPSTKEPDSGKVDNSIRSLSNFKHFGFRATTRKGRGGGGGGDGGHRRGTYFRCSKMVELV